MSGDKIEFEVDGTTFELHAEAQGANKRPLVVIAHAWAGQTDTERGWAADLAEQGYTAVALDVYGKGVRGNTTEECSALMTPLVEDRDLLLRRLHAGIDAAKQHAAADGSKVAAIGFCFGGLSVLDLARTGTDLRGVVSFHGLFMPRPNPPKDVKAKVLICHGYEDPMADPEAFLGFAKEMNDAGVQWEAHIYGHAKHAFTNPAANDEQLGTVYHPVAAARAKTAMTTFLTELFA
ncbi:MAG: dienelactone hydrolase family protein [Myxococcota bacterium]